MLSQVRELYRTQMVPSVPSLPPWLWLRRPNERIGQWYPFNHSRIRYTYSCTAAIYQAMGVLKLSPDETVLSPSYNCGHEIEPILRRNVRLQFYNVNRDLGLDLGDIERKLNANVRALLVTHYFGFPQPLDEISHLCKARGLYLIEDCAHALFSKDIKGGYLGATGDIALFSLRKTLPLPNGGALVINNPDLEVPDVAPMPPFATTWNKLLELLRKFCSITPESMSQQFFSRVFVSALIPLILGRRLMRHFPLWKAYDWYDPDDERLDFENPILHWNMSAVGHGILRRQEPEAVLSRRRRNYAFISQSLKGQRSTTSLKRELLEGVCPLNYPILCKDRRDLRRRLARKGFASDDWWSSYHPGVPWEEFPDAVFLKEHVLALPIHQDISEEKLEYLVDFIQRA